MAVTPPTEEAFLREVDEELRRDQLQTMWKRYGVILLVLIGLFLAGFAGYLYWRAQTEKQAEAQGEQLSAAISDLEAGRKTDAGKKLDALIGEGRPAYGIMGRFAKAAMLGQDGNIKGAAALYAAIAADEQVASPYRDLAVIRQTLIEYDSLKPQQVIERLKPLAVEGNAFFGTAGELTAIAMIQTGRGVEAGRLLATIARQMDLPEALRARAGRLANSLGADVTPDKD